MIIKTLPTPILVTTPGTPVPLASTPTKASQIFVQGITGNTGKVVLGTQGVSVTTLAHVRKLFWPTGAGGGQPQEHEIVAYSDEDVLEVSAYFIDAANAGEGLVVSWIEA